MNTHRYETFGDLLDDTLPKKATVYASPWIGEKAAHSVATHSNTDTLVTSLEEGAYGIFEEYDNVKVTSYKEDAGRADEVDAEFTAPLGRETQPDMSQSDIRKQLKDWAEISRDIVAEDGAAVYTDNVWKDLKSSPLNYKNNDNTSIHDIHTDTIMELRGFEDVRTFDVDLDGERYTGVVASPHSQEK